MNGIQNHELAKLRQLRKSSEQDADIDRVRPSSRNHGVAKSDSLSDLIKSGRTSGRSVCRDVDRQPVSFDVNHERIARSQPQLAGMPFQRERETILRIGIDRQTPQEIVGSGDFDQLPLTGWHLRLCPIE